MHRLLETLDGTAGAGSGGRGGGVTGSGLMARIHTGMPSERGSASLNVDGGFCGNMLGNLKLSSSENGFSSNGLVGKTPALAGFL